MKCKNKIIITFVLIGFFCVFRSVKIAEGATTTNIDSTIQISVCGNGTAEGGEDCDNTDFKGKSCASLGFESGNLSCNLSCSIDTSDCIVATPVPTPTPTINAAPSNQPVSQTTSEESKVIPTVEPTALPVGVPEVSQEENKIIDKITSVISNFPESLKFFGADEKGNIEPSELRQSVALWVEQWQAFLGGLTVQDGKVMGQDTIKKCDFNNDHSCNLVDLSIMLYYVKK